MANLTDPAREIAEICARLDVPSGERGDEFLAKQFEVETWSRDFYLIVFCIVERIQFLKGIIEKLDIDSDFQAEAIQHVLAIQAAFHTSGFANAWNVHGQHHVGAANAQPLKMLSPMVRQLASYPSLDDDERADLLSDVNDLCSWLKEHQLREQDFIRQALIEGLEQLAFRIGRLKWVGWGYSLESLKEVIGAYFALERTNPTAADNPDAEAVLRKVSSFCKVFYEKAKFGKDVVEVGDFALRMYGAIAMARTLPEGVVGLLTQAISTASS